MKKIFDGQSPSLFSFSHTHIPKYVHKCEPWWSCKLTIRTRRRDCKTTCAKWQKENIDNVLLLGKGGLLVEEGKPLLFSLHWKHDELSTCPRNICCSELRPMQPLLSSCLLCFFHLTWFPAIRFPKNFIIDHGWGIKHVTGTSVFHTEILRLITFGLPLTLGPTSLPLQLQL